MKRTFNDCSNWTVNNSVSAHCAAFALTWPKRYNVAVIWLWAQSLTGLGPSWLTAWPLGHLVFNSYSYSYSHLYLYSLLVYVRCRRLHSIRFNSSRVESTRRDSVLFGLLEAWLRFCCFWTWAAYATRNCFMKRKTG